LSLAFIAISFQEQLPLFVIPEGNLRFVRITKATSEGEPLKNPQEAIEVEFVALQP
jgi:hypothetical protein